MAVFYSVILFLIEWGWNLYSGGPFGIAFQAMTVGFWVIGAVYMLLLSIAGLLMAVSLVKAASAVRRGEVVSMMDCVSYGFANLWDVVCLGARVGWYVFKWVLPVILVLVAYAIFNTFYSIMPGFDIASAASLINGNPLAEFGEAMNQYQTMGYANYLLSGLGLIAAVMAVYFGIVRGTKSAFAFYAFVEDGLKGKAALDKSIEIVKGRFWKVFGYCFFAGLLLILALFIPFQLIIVFVVGWNVFDPTVMLILTGISLLLSGGVAGVLAIFLNTFYLKLKK